MLRVYLDMSRNIRVSKLGIFLFGSKPSAKIDTSVNDRCVARHVVRVRLPFVWVGWKKPSPNESCRWQPGFTTVFKSPWTIIIIYYYIPLWLIKIPINIPIFDSNNSLYSIADITLEMQHWRFATERCSHRVFKDIQMVENPTKSNSMALLDS